MARHFSKPDDKQSSGYRPVISRSDYEASHRPSYVRGGYHQQRLRRRKRHHIGRIIGIIMLVLIVLVGVEGFALYRSAKTVKSSAQTVLGQVSLLKESLKSGDADTLRSTVEDITSETSVIDAEVHSPAWIVASYVPVYGEDVKSIQVLGDVSANLTQNALTPFSRATENVQLSSLFANGQVDVDAIQTLSDSISSVAPVVHSSADALDALPKGHITQVAETIAKVKAPLSSASETLDKFEAVIPYLPQMLGSDGQTRNYLLVAQNNAEIRATGGFPGSWMLVSITNGSISLSDAQTLQGKRDYTFSITDEEKNFFGSDMGVSPANLNCTPDFTRVGTLFAEVWQDYMGQDVDGVIAVDPVFLQDLLALTGGVTAPDGATVDGTNAAKVLLSDTYWKYPDGDTQDAYFAVVASEVAQKIMDGLGGVDMSSLVQTVQQDASERRVQVWMSDQDEEQAIQSMKMGGELSSDSTQPVLGVYVNDNTWGKMCWYLKLSTDIGSATTNSDGTITYSVTTSVTNTATDDELASAPEYVIGNSPAKRDDGDIYLSPVLLMAPAGGKISDVSVSGTATMGEGALYGFDTWSGSVNIEPQETVTYTYKVTTAAGATTSLALDTTPTGQRF